MSVWVKLYVFGEEFVGDPFKVKPIPEDVDDLKDAVKLRVAPKLDNVTPDEMFVYPSNTQIVSNPVVVLPEGVDKLDPWVELKELEVSGKDPLVVVAGARRVQPVPRGGAVAAVHPSDPAVAAPVAAIQTRAAAAAATGDTFTFPPTRRSKKQIASTTDHQRRFSEVCSHHPKGQLVADIFYGWFTENYPAGWALDRRAGDLDKVDKDKFSCLLTRFKRTAKLLLYFCDKYPRERPNTSDEDELDQWRDEIKTQGQVAQALIKAELFPDNPRKKMTECTVNTCKYVKEWEETKCFPYNTPEEAAHYFGTERRSIRIRKKPSATEARS